MLSFIPGNRFQLSSNGIRRCACCHLSSLSMTLFLLSNCQQHRGLLLRKRNLNITHNCITQISDEGNAAKESQTQCLTSIFADQCQHGLEEGHGHPLHVHRLHLHLLCGQSCRESPRVVLTKFSTQRAGKGSVPGILAGYRCAGMMITGTLKKERV